MAREQLNLAIFISGGGSTMEHILNECYRGGLPGINPALVLSSDPQAGGVGKAVIAHPRVQIATIRPRDFRGNQTAFGEAILEQLRKEKVDYIIQCGWLPFTPLNVVEAYQGRIFNQHPGPLANGEPDFGGKGMYGLRVHAARLFFVRKARRKLQRTYVLTHRVVVNNAYDNGEVIHHRHVDIMPGDNPHTLQQRALKEEYLTQIEALRMISEGTVQAAPPYDEILVHPHELEILQQAKEYAIMMYP